MTVVKLDEDEISDEELGRVRAELLEDQGVSRRIMAHEAMLSFNSQCIYTRYDPTLVDVDGVPRRVWGFHTNGWACAEEFARTLIEIPGLTECLQRTDKGGHMYFNWEEP